MPYSGWCAECCGGWFLTACSACIGAFIVAGEDTWRDWAYCDDFGSGLVVDTQCYM